MSYPLINSIINTSDLEFNEPQTTFLFFAMSVSV